MTKNIEKLQSLLFNQLLVNCPYLSGNMLNNISVKPLSDKKVEITISAKFYDVDLFKNKGVIKFTNENHNGITNYAMWVDNYGGFFSHNKSENWITNTVADCCNVIGNEIGAKVDNRL